MLELENICYKNVLENINLKARRGDFVLVRGENGAGKSTLFNIISGKLKPTSGRVLFDQQDIGKMNLRERTRLIANVLQDPRQGTVGEMTICENLNIAYRRGKRRFCTIAKKELRSLFRERLAVLQMGLENRLDEYVRNLSGGQRQALSLVMSTIAEYEVILMDEITAALDTKTSKLVMQIATDLAKTYNKICLAITHDQNLT